MEDLGQIDNLGLSSLGPPLLSEYFGSAVQREDVLKIAREIMQRHLAKLPSDTGKLKSTARITTPRVRHPYDSRYEAVYTIGGGRADYIVPLEAEHHYLDEVLREMGFYTGDVAHGPTGKVAPEARAPKAVERAQPKRSTEARGMKWTRDYASHQSASGENFQYAISGRTLMISDVTGVIARHTDTVKQLKLIADRHEASSFADQRSLRAQMSEPGIHAAEQEAGINSGHTVQRPEPSGSPFRLSVSKRTYEEFLSTDMTSFAREAGLPDPVRRGRRYDYGELPEAQAREVLRHLENSGDSTGFDDRSAINAARAAAKDYDELRTAFDADRPDAPYTTFMSEVQQNMRNQGGQ